MTRTQNVILQIIALAGQMLIPVAPISPDWTPFVHALGAVIQGAVGIIAHSFTPEGDKL